MLVACKNPSWREGRGHLARVALLVSCSTADLLLLPAKPLDQTYGLSDTLLQRVKARYGENGKGTIFDRSFGYIIVSENYANQLTVLIQNDRQEVPLDY